MPVWFPFALVASFLVMLGTGARTGFKTPADLADEEEKKKRAAAGGGTPAPAVQGSLSLSEEGVWPFRFLPPLVTVRGRRFVKGSALRAEGVEPHAIYDEVGGKRRVVVLPTGRFVVVG